MSIAVRRSGIISRADLLEALSTCDDDERGVTAGLLGYSRARRKKAKPENVARQISNEIASPPPVLDSGTRALLSIPFWRLDRYAASEGAPSTVAIPNILPEWRNRPKEPSESYWIERWPHLAPRLLKALCGTTPSADYDIEQTAELVACGRSLDHLPKKVRPKLLPQVQVVFDRSEHLMPYWDDQEVVAATLRRVLGEAAVAVEYAFVRETPDEPVLEHIRGQSIYAFPPAGSAILVLGDLGCLTQAKYLEVSWLRFGRRARAAGCRTVALTPGPVGLVESRLRRLWDVVPWRLERGAPQFDRQARLKKARRLLALLSHAFRIEPGLLRAARLALGADGGDVGIEAEAWGQIERKHHSAGTMDPVAADELRREFNLESEDVKRRVLACQFRWRHSVKDEIWFDEVVNLPSDVQALLPHPEDVAQARRFFAFTEDMTGARNRFGSQVASWLANKVAPRATGNAWAVPEFAKAIYNVKKDDPDFTLPGVVDPAAIGGPQVFAGPLRLQIGDGALMVGAALADLRRGTAHLGVLPSHNGILTHSIVAEMRPDPALFWRERQSPAWASDWGEDAFGVWATFSIGEVTQRMRWIAPGRFLMGSPEDEPGRFGEDAWNEGPRHQVTLKQGFWLFDTPVTQALWGAVMGDNPSRFVSLRRPVEQVSWDDAARFLERINTLVPGIDLVLPTEAQWERACRAGTNTATYAGPMEILGANNVPVLDDIAWYGGNSGVGFELENGVDSSGWPEKQYEHSQAGTHPVGLKAPNAWGLYDMLGNVWEWCADDLRQYEGRQTVDPVGATDSARRALRGGSWYLNARYVRAAFRVAFDRVSRSHNIGFRCARVQANGRGEAEPVDRGDAQQAERRAALRLTGAAESALRLSSETGAGAIPLPVVGRVRVISDRATLEFGQIGRPTWADQMGSDAHGLFAEFIFEGVIQRMRWIAPGRFLMGSPDEEKGRFDNEGPQHEVTLTKGYWLFDTPVTQGLWEAVMDKNPSRFKGVSHPVDNVTWNDANVFLTRINERIPEIALVLPTEAQWEYACRAGTRTANYAGGEEALADIAWVTENSESKTQPVAQKRCNDWGLYDMLGNVWEWCGDDLRKYGSESVVDPVGPVGARRALRGGSWFNDARRVRAAPRDAYGRDDRYVNFGFRCARVRP